MRRMLPALLVFATVAAFGTNTTTKPIDSGTFGVFVGGKRIATEKFDIQQRGNVSITTAELRADDAGNKSTQSSELQLTSGGELVKYTWKESTEGAKAVVEPSNEFLVEHISAGDGKPHDTPFLLPHSTMILDDYSFAQRQVLAWRYLASVCSAGAQGQLDCKGERTQFGVLIPQQQSAASVYLTLKGKEKISIRGTERELNRINLESDAGDWSMWFDDNNKLVRILVPDSNTEIIRD